MPIPFNPPEPVYPNFGQSLGQGIQQGVANFNTRKEQQQQAQMLQMQLFKYSREMESMDLADELKRAQIAELKGNDVYFDTKDPNRLITVPHGAKPLPGTSGGAKKAYVDEIISRYQGDPKSITDEEKQFAGIQNKRTIISAETAKLIENSQSGLRALDQMEDAIRKDPSVYRYAQPNAVGRVGAAIVGTEGQNYRTAAKTAMDVITRLRTGAALNANEEKFYGGLIPNIEDTTDSAKNKIQQLREFYSGVTKRLEAGTFQGGGGGGTESPRASTKKFFKSSDGVYVSEDGGKTKRKAEFGDFK